MLESVCRAAYLAIILGFIRNTSRKLLEPCRIPTGRPGKDRMFTGKTTVNKIFHNF